MNIKGNISFKDNLTLVYINIALVVVCAFLLYAYIDEIGNKPLIAVDSGYNTYSARMIRVEDPQAIDAQIRAHLSLSYGYLYNLTEYNYESNIEKALHLWSFTGGQLVTDYEREGLYDFLSTTPSRTECLIKSIKPLGQKVADIQYPEVNITSNGDISFQTMVRNGVKTYSYEVVTYRRIVRGMKIVSEEIHTETVEVYTGFDINQEYNPFGYKTETITRTIEQINVGTNTNNE
ncbi:hypothetical protein AAOE16_18075 [Ekhidna sp. MALMAid0563]|uniref:hypothetical protein n=1 Tax=Ekhidna sp. MALMAid0563 TaxID=3143937 RepID=UPI0032DF2C54